MIRMSDFDRAMWRAEMATRHGWRYVETDGHGTYFQRRLRTGRWVAIVIDFAGFVSVSGN